MRLKLLSEDFLAKYKERTPPWGPVGEVTYLRTYSRDGEDWTDTTARWVEGCYYWQKQHCEKSNRPWDEEQARKSAETMFDLGWNMKFLPPGRGLWSMGTAILLKTGSAANNCGFVSTQSGVADSASWLMDMLMLGVGVGFDTKGSGKIVTRPWVNQEQHMVIEDSREGWVLSVKLLLDTYFNEKEDYISFDYSQIREAGLPIRGFGGTSSGAGPLKELHKSLRTLLDSRIDQPLREMDIVDIMNFIGRCVVAGNVRRSAEIALGKPSDEFMDIKSREKYPEELDSHRWASNNSVVMVPGSDYYHIAQRIANNGEPGILWLENARAYDRMGRKATWTDYEACGVNPCAEQTLEDRELCCLVETFPSRCDNYYEYQKVLKYAYLYAKTVTTIPTHNEDTNRVINKNRRIGCSMSGIQEAIVRVGAHSFFNKWCKEGYKYLRSLDARYSEWLGIPRSNKITSVKPSGTVSKLPGVTSGIHFGPSRFYYQVLRFSSDNPNVERYKKAGYRVVNRHPHEPNTHCIYFACKLQDGVRAEAEVSMWEQLEHAAQMQHHWADNQVSVTVKFHAHEAHQIAAALSLYDTRLKSVSFLPHEDHGFDHAPWQPISEEEYNAYKAQLKPLDLETVHDADDLFCSGPACEVKW